MSDFLYIYRKMYIYVNQIVQESIYFCLNKRALATLTTSAACLPPGGVRAVFVQMFCSPPPPPLPPVSEESPESAAGLDRVARGRQQQQRRRTRSGRPGSGRRWRRGGWRRTWGAREKGQRRQVGHQGETPCQERGNRAPPTGPLAGRPLVTWRKDLARGRAAEGGGGEALPLPHPHSQTGTTEACSVLRKGQCELSFEPLSSHLAPPDPSLHRRKDVGWQRVGGYGGAGSPGAHILASW